MLMPQWRGTAAEITAIAHVVEASGFDSIWVNEHIAIPIESHERYPYRADGALPMSPDVPWTEAMVTLGYLAGVTSRVRLGSAVIALLTRDPITLAKQAATVDVVSSGRLELGLGAGWLLEEARVLGHPTDGRIGRLREAISILRLAWSQPEFTFDGHYYKIPKVAVHPHPVQGRVPIWIGGTGPEAIRLAAEQCGMVLSISLNPSPAEVAEFASRLRPDQPTAGLIAPVSIDSDRAVEVANALAKAGATAVMAVSYQPVKRAAEQLAEFARAMRA